jgi:hypothetical protein
MGQPATAFAAIVESRLGYCSGSSGPGVEGEARNWLLRRVDLRCADTAVKEIL